MNADLIRANEGRVQTLNVVACQTCGGTDQRVHAFRATRCTVFMCGGCALAIPLYEGDTEAIVSAVAMDQLSGVAA